MKSESTVTVVGIDVGGRRKGFHAVALRNGRFHEQFTSKEVAPLISWCVEKIRAAVIAVDAPCRWSKTEKSRPAERELHGKGVHCFFTPTRQIAIAHPKNNFGWMFNGETVFKRLEQTHPLALSRLKSGSRYCFETFPHAITWHLRGGHADAKHKRTQRRQLLEIHGIEMVTLTNIDWVDAALCALTAHKAASGELMENYGEAQTGLIIVPATRR